MVNDSTSDLSREKTKGHNLMQISHTPFLDLFPLV